MKIMEYFQQIMNYDAAMEADDITKDVDAGMKDLKTPTAKQDNSEIDNNTDDILGTKGDDSTKTDKESDSDEDTSNTDDNSDGTENEDDQNNPLDKDDDSADDTTSDDNSSMDDSSSDTTDEKDKKLKLHKNFMYLQNTIQSNLDVITSISIDQNDVERNKILHYITSNFSRCLEAMDDILGEAFIKSKYLDLVQKYQALKQVYDIILDICEIYFKHDLPEGKNFKKKSKNVNNI